MMSDCSDPLPNNTNYIPVGGNVAYADGHANWHVFTNGPEAKSWRYFFTTGSSRSVIWWSQEPAPHSASMVP